MKTIRQRNGAEDAVFMLKTAMAQSKSGNKSAGLKDNFQQGDGYEKYQFFYHPDHLGSSSFITDTEGEVVQHIEYVPYGEVFIEERNNVWNSPYLFNAKEYDEETGLYYYGARYYDPRLAMWYGVDPLTVAVSEICALTELIVAPCGSSSRSRILWHLFSFYLLRLSLNFMEVTLNK